MKNKKIIFIATIILSVVILNENVLASTILASITDIPIVKNLENLLQDAIKWFYIILPIVCLGSALYFFIRKTMSSEQEAHSWNKRIIGAFITLGVAMSATFIVQLVVSMAGSGTI